MPASRDGEIPVDALDGVDLPYEDANYPAGPLRARARRRESLQTASQPDETTLRADRTS